MDSVKRAKKTNKKKQTLCINQLDYFELSQMGSIKSGEGTAHNLFSHIIAPDLPGSDWEAVVGTPTSGKGKCDVSQ